MLHFFSSATMVQSSKLHFSGATMVASSKLNFSGAHNCCFLIRDAVRKNGMKWEKFLNGAPPPQYWNNHVTKNVKVFLRFRASGAFLVFTKMLKFWVTN